MSLKFPISLVGKRGGEYVPPVDTLAYDISGNVVLSTNGNLPNNFGKSRSDIVRVEIGSSVTTIGSDVFSYCPNLEGDLYFHGGITSFGTFFGRNGPDFDSITFAEGITSVGLSMFLSYYGTKKLDLVMPSTLITIPSEAFNANSANGKNSWGQLYLNEGLQTMGQQIFNYKNIGANQTLVLPSTLLSINRWNFRGTLFNRIEILAVNAPVINPEAFANMSFVADNSIHVPSNATGYAASYGGFTVVYDLPAG